MKTKILGGAAVAMASVALALGAGPAQARHKAHRAPKAEAAKHACGGKNGCPAASKAAEKTPTPAAEKPADAKADAKPSEAKPAGSK